jgi:hypothetical protein
MSTRVRGVTFKETVVCIVTGVVSTNVTCIGRVEEGNALENVPVLEAGSHRRVDRTAY